MFSFLPMNRLLLFGSFSAAVVAGLTTTHAAPPNPTPPPQEYKKLPDPPVDPARDKALYTVAYAHLDTQWRWSYPQVVRDYVADTLHDNFKFIEKYPNYVFNFSGSRRYEMMREYYPEDYGKLKDYIATGHWFPCGSSVDECDANVPGLESFVRQILYGNRYFEGEFNKTSTEFLLPDCFGFPASLPSILAHCGLKGFSTQKLTWGSANGVPFKVGTWTGPDGKTITAALDPGAYTGGISEDLSRSQGWLKRINNTGEKSGAYVDYHYYGTGDRGGAPQENAVKWLESSLVGGGPVRVVSATAERMFNDLTADQIAKLPNYKGELLLTEHSAGSITSQAYMKRWNRKNELLADAAERASVTAMLLGGAPYPARKLYEGWDLVLGSQMHDMLPGTSLPKAYEYCWNDEILAANHFAAAELDAVGAVAAGLNTESTEKGGVPLVIYNALAQERSGTIEATVTFPGTVPETLYARHGDDEEQPVQILSRSGNQAKVLFAATVPSLGFAVYEVYPGRPYTNGAATLQVTQNGLSNERYRVTLDANGDVSSIFDKGNNEELLAGPARWEFHYEKPVHYPAWNMDWADRQKPATGYVDGPAKVRIVESGPVRVALEVEREARGSRFVQTIRLTDKSAGGDQVEFFNTVDWQTPEVSLKAAFPFKHANPLASYDDKVGVVERGNNEEKKYEVPQHQWFDLTGTDGKYGAAVLNDSKFGSDKPDDQTLRLTLLYTPGVRNDYQDQASQDFGHHEIRYAVTGHAGDWRAGGVPAQAADFNQPLAAFQTTEHPGKLGKGFAGLQISAPQVALVALKKAEASDEVVVRLLETTGRPAKGVEVFAGIPLAAAREINGQEKPVGPATLRDGRLVTDLGPFGVRAFAIKVADLPVRLNAPQSQPVKLAYDLDAVSSQKNRADGNFDDGGITYPAEQFPKTLQSEGVDFQLGSTADGQKNAVICRGQTIDLPTGDFDHVYFLAAARNQDAQGTFKVGDQAHDQVVQDWSAFIGQWDNRRWKGTVPELTYAWHNDLDGLVPGFTKRDTVAWYASHRHLGQKGNDFYQYCYLFKYGFALPEGARQITLPDNPKIAVFAVTVARNDHEGTVAAQPLYDTLKSKDDSRPRISPAGGSFNESTVVSIVPPLYWEGKGLHYTTDGSEPTLNSPTYNGPFRLSADATVRARMFWPDRRAGGEGSAKLAIHDTTAPKVVSAGAVSVMPQVMVRFSEPVDRASAESPASYHLEPATVVRSVRVTEDGFGATLTLEKNLSADDPVKLVADGVKDRAPAGNRVSAQGVSVTVGGAVYTLDRFVGDGKNSQTVDVPGLPVGAQDPWTINFFVKMDKQPENRTLLVGFGDAKDEGGHARYLAKFANGIHFWCADEDVETTTRYALNTWQMLTASFDGKTLTVYKDGQPIGQGSIHPADDKAVVQLAPVDPWDKERRFAGEIRRFTIWNAALDAGTIQALHAAQQP